jgi:hypothetical protein
METRRLRALQPPSEVEKMLDAIILGATQLPKGSRQIRDAGELPTPLQVIVIRATQEGRVWSCWANNFETWLFTCEMSLSLSRERGVPVLLVNRYAERGELEDSASWVAYADGKWFRCPE